MQSNSTKEDVIACSPEPDLGGTAGGTTQDTQRAVMSNYLWPPASDDGGPYVLNYYFMGGTTNQQEAVTATVKTWSAYANVRFQSSADKNSDIRISFDRNKKGTWASVGIKAKSRNTELPTMNFRSIADVNPPSAKDAATILHEWGHVLGMRHEHQSPARGGYIHLKELAVYDYYSKIDAKLVKKQVIDMDKLSDVSNFSRLDLNSIMMYSMPARLNEEGIDIPDNLVLSDLDKAFITLNYPHKPKEGEIPEMSLLRALGVAGVPKDVSATITQYVDDGTLESYQKARNAFTEYNKGVMQLNSVNQSFLNSINPDSGAQLRMRDTIANVVKNPLFHSVVKNIVSQVFVQRAIPTVVSIPGSAQRDVLNTIGAVITNPMFAKAVNDINAEFTGLPIAPSASAN